MREDSLNCDQMRQLLQRTSFADLTPAQQEHLAGCDQCMELLVSEALEAKPQIAIPENFAARVAAGLPPPPNPRRSRLRPQYGRVVAFASLGILVAGMASIAVVSPQWLVANRAIWLLIETLTLAETGAIAYWLGRQNDSM
jgi:hypothetical protein